jgi:hypothetical protein
MSVLLHGGHTHTEAAASGVDPALYGSVAVGALVVVGLLALALRAYAGG